MEPVTREEIFLSAAGKEITLPKPVTRREKYLAAAAGEEVDIPEPVTREEVFLKQIAEGGGGGKITVQELSVTENGEYTAPEGISYTPVKVSVSGGGAPTNEPNDVTFYDYDGTIAYSYSAEEFAALEAMPENPAHAGLTAQGWNWGLSDAQEYVQNNGSLNIGQMYITDDGKTRLYIQIDDLTRPLVTIRFQATVDGGVVIDWGDGSETETSSGTSVADYTHTYIATGEYVISLEVVSGTLYLNSLSSGSVGSIMGYASNSTIYNLVRLRRVELGEGIPFLTNNAFYMCYNLKSVTMPAALTDVRDNAFQSSGLKSITLPAALTSVNSQAFRGCSLESVSFPPGLTSFGNYAFANLSRLKRITFPPRVAKLGGYSFNSNSALETIRLPDVIPDVGSYAFQNCVRLFRVVLPPGLDSIEQYEFHHCYALTSITIPAAVTRITTGAFMECYAMKEYHLLPANPPTLAATGALCVPTDCIIYVPQGSLAAYQSATNWSTYASYMQEETA